MMNIGLLLAGWQVLLASSFVLVLFSFVEGSWSTFWVLPWQARFATWGRNLCLIGCGATIEFLVHHSELLGIIGKYEMKPKTATVAPLSLSQVDVADVLLILLLIVVPAGIVNAIESRVAPMTRWAGIVCVFFGGIVLSLPLVIRYWFTR